MTTEHDGLVSLKPCPKCNGEPRKRICSATEFDEDFYVSCGECGLRTMAFCFPHLAQESWNERPYIDALMEEIAELGDVAKGCAKREREALTRAADALSLNEDVERVNDSWNPDPEDPFWMLEIRQGFEDAGSWLKNEQTYLTIRDPVRAIRYPSRFAAECARRRLPLEHNGRFEPTEHLWITFDQTRAAMPSDTMRALVLAARDVRDRFPPRLGCSEDEQFPVEAKRIRALEDALRPFDKALSSPIVEGLSGVEK